MYSSYLMKRPAPGEMPNSARPRETLAQRSIRSLPARIASGDRVISTAGRIVSTSENGATVEVMFPSRGPSVIMLHVLDDSQIYEVEVRWRTDARIGVRFLDILGPRRRRLYFTDQPVPLQTLPNRMLQLAELPPDLHWPSRSLALG